MKNKIKIFILLFVTSQAFAWTDEEIESMHYGCMETVSSKYSDTQKMEYCSCSTGLAIKTWTLDQLIAMLNNNTLRDHKDFKKIVNDCTKKVTNEYEN
ncbi:MAG: hypothetical protein CMD90_02495 [Gammaproteobacteria bacterium]|nr:hypothetical protein [Gammaproteobacteria bacterium]|tara:strand:+ start:217 stop:510 length:294 start_codon:yes stop_codon:yes gene_type:complete